jgi:AraC-like DNA-binding protein
MDYREYEPRPPLTRLVACLWTLEGHAAETGGTIQPILPDGRPEIVLHFGDPFRRVHGDGSVDVQPRLIYAGQLTGQLLLSPTARIGVLGIRFHPDGAAAMIAAPQHELAGRTIDVGDVARKLARTLGEVLDAVDSPAAAVALVQARLARLAAAARPDPRVRFVVETIRRRRGDVPIGRLAQATGSSTRHLERRFQHLVGIPPKRLARIVRFQHALQLLDTAAGGRPDGTRTAATCGYADQAHFVRDFRDLAGCPPGAHLLRQAELTGFFRDRLE